MKPELHHQSEFETILEVYTPNDRSNEIMRRVKAVLLVGPSSSGRNTIIRKLLETGKYHFIVSDTTRPRRQNDGVWEQDGVEYWFRSEEEILDDLKNGEFLEAAIIHDQQVSGISIRELEKTLDDKKIAINEIEVTGAASVRRQMPNAKLLYILPPSFDVWYARLTARGAMTEHEERNRLTSALDELEHLKTGYYSVVINDDLDDAVTQVRSILEDGRDQPYLASKAQRVAEQLQADIQLHLSTT